MVSKLEASHGFSAGSPGLRVEGTPGEIRTCQVLGHQYPSDLRCSDLISFQLTFLQNQFSRNKVSKSIGVPSLLYDIHCLSHSAE